jgi:superfamily II DNA or RNA helicase
VAWSIAMLRYYQVDAIESAERAFAQGHKRVLIVAATGLGKTRLFNDLIALHVARGERVLLLAHREELIRQSAVRLFLDTEIASAVEMAAHKEGSAAAEPAAAQSLLVRDGSVTALGTWMRDEGHEVAAVEVSRDQNGRPRVVVASVQSLVRRLAKHAESDFDLVVIDEAHHSVADTYRAITDHFAKARVLGVTATPNRGDKVALAETFDVCAFQMSLPEGIEQGWLVPVRARSVETSIDLSKVRSVAGDLNQKDLAKVLSELGALHEIAAPIVEECGDRQTMVFAVTVAHAHLLAEVLREHVAERAQRLGRPLPGPLAVLAIDGSADDDRRLETVLAFRDGRCQVLVNVALYTEGADFPSCAAVAMARPTKSLGAFLQMLGRGTRTLPGIVDPLPAREQAEERRAAIAASAKPDLLVLDFVGNTGKHQIVRTIDALAGDGVPEKALAKGILARGDTDDVLAALAMARRQISEMEAAKLREQARRGYRASDVSTDGAAPHSGSAATTKAKTLEQRRRELGYDPSPWDLLGYTPRPHTGPPPTEKQRSYLVSQEIDTRGMSAQTASNLIKSLFHRRDKGLASYKMAKLVAKYGVAPELARKLTFDEAKGLIRELADNDWRPPHSWALRFGRFRVGESAKTEAPR